jgi:hypothetical protein
MRGSPSSIGAKARRRSTLTHECSHAIQHAPLWQALGPEQPTDGPVAISCRCEHTEATYDLWDAWMEWQARHMSGAFLMPKSRVLRLAQRLAESNRYSLPVQLGTPQSIYLTEHVVIAFYVSSDAATVRLRQLGLLARK